MEIMPLAAVERIATLPYAGAALLPKAGPAEVIAAHTGQEYIPAAALASLHGAAIQLPRGFRQRRQVHVVGDGDQQINIFWRGFRRGERPDQGDSFHTRETRGGLNK